MSTQGIVSNHQAKETTHEYMSSLLHDYIIPPAAETTVDMGPYELFELPQVVRFVPLWTIHSRRGDLKAVTPIRVRVYKEDRFYFAENDKLAVCGVGTSSMDAMDDLQSHIAHFWTYYSNLEWEQLTGDAIRLKKIYSELLVEDK